MCIISLLSSYTYLSSSKYSSIKPSKFLESTSATILSFKSFLLLPRIYRSDTYTVFHDKSESDPESAAPNGNASHAASQDIINVVPEKYMDVAVPAKGKNADGNASSGSEMMSLHSDASSDGFNNDAIDVEKAFQLDKLD